MQGLTVVVEGPVKPPSKLSDQNWLLLACSGRLYPSRTCAHAINHRAIVSV
jgi:hypothetical protein